MRTALVLQHSDHVTLDLVGEWLAARDWRVETHWPAREATPSLLAADLVVVLGGTMGVYETAAHPWISEELAALRARLDAGGRTLGLCLGAQMMAAALGARVYRGGAGKEIGWKRLTLTQAGQASVLAPLDGLALMQWHGDTFDLPDGATHLARDALYEHQAFAFGAHALALQFHLEVSAAGLETWLTDRNDPELAEIGLTAGALRAEAALAAPRARDAAFAVLDSWME